MNPDRPAHPSSGQPEPLPDLPLRFVTIPRSAYHLLAKRATYYYEDRLRHYESTRYRPLDWRREQRRGCHLFGTHDDALRRSWPARSLLECPQRSDWRYVALFRNPLFGAVSHFQLRERNEFAREGTYQEWLAHLDGWTDFTRRFARKWLLTKRPSLPILRLSYEQIQAEPEATLAATLGHARDPDWQPDPAKVSQSVERYPFRPVPQLEAFRYYERKRFLTLREDLKDAVAFMEAEPSYRISVEIP